MASRTSLEVVKNNRSFVFFLMGQGVVSIAETFNFISITALLIQITNSGKYASFAVLCTPIASFLLSPFAGGIGDRYNEKHLIILISLARGITTALFVSNHKITRIYILMLILASLEVLCNPPRKSLMLNILGYGHIMIGNSIFQGLSGFVFIIGPMIAGAIIKYFSIKAIFLVTSFLYFLSTVLFFFVKNKFSKRNIKRQIKSSIYEDMRSGYRYFRSQSKIKEIIVLNTLVSLLIASTNTVFYPFAFDYLKVTSNQWGIMMSVFYGTNMLAMMISIYLNKTIKRTNLLLFYFSITMVSIVWILYSISDKLITVIVLQFTEGLFISLGTIILNTKLQTLTNRDYSSRIISINDLINNVGKLISIFTTYFLLRFQPPQFIFVLNFVIILSYCMYKLLFSRRRLLDI